MIRYIKGILTLAAEEEIVIENNNIGYEMKVPSSVIEQLPVVGSEVMIYTYLYVREDALQLYGFLSYEDVEIFMLLIKVSGIGPKGALGILSTISPDDLRFAVLSEDTKTISKAPGIGRKTASKLILELKDKLLLEDSLKMTLSEQTPIEGGEVNIQKEAVMALTALGYSHTDALKATRMVEVTDNMTVEEVLKLSLRQLSLL